MTIDSSIFHVQVIRTFFQLSNFFKSSGVQRNVLHLFSFLEIIFTLEGERGMIALTIHSFLLQMFFINISHLERVCLFLLLTSHGHDAARGESPSRERIVSYVDLGECTYEVTTVRVMRRRPRTWLSLLVFNGTSMVVQSFLWSMVL